MGRALLILCAAAFAAACDLAPETGRVVVDGSAGATAAGPDAHAALPCTACHTGELAGSRPASVPRAACATSGCHQEGGPATVSTATATFHHRDHARDGELALSCAGCHTHAEGREPLRVSVDGCALCHLSDLKGSHADDCRLCHQRLQHTALTSQALPVPHSSLPWVETGCVRCHYDVAAAPTRVPLARCTACHGRDTEVVARGIATDLHPAHVSVTCTACHEGGSHRVRAMSSAVDLVCADCHVREHGVSLTAQWNDGVTCAACHERVHQAQQRLLLGVLPDARAAPSSKFIAGITCRSCHIRTEQNVVAGDAIRGQAEACAGCHRTEYRQVLQWWLDGTRRKSVAMSAWVARAQAELQAPPDSARALLAAAREMVELVRTAGGQHNLELSDRMFRESVTNVQRAYALSRRVPPTAPELGSPAHEGVCSYCHYSPQEPWDFRRMSESFHRAVLSHE